MYRSMMILYGRYHLYVPISGAFLRVKVDPITRSFLHRVRFDKHAGKGNKLSLDHKTRPPQSIVEFPGRR